MQNQILTINDLNDDCLDYIFRLVTPLAEQLQASRVCQRFQNIYKRIWRNDAKYFTLELNQWRETLPKVKDLQYFLHIISDKLKELKSVEDCLNVMLEDLEQMNITCLPSIQRCDMSDFVDCYPNDCDISALSKLLPNLKYLRLTAPITGRFISNFKYLEELHLYDEQDKEYEIKSEYLDKICVQLKHLRVLDIRAFELSYLSLTNIKYCQNLEVLKLNLSVLKPVLYDVLNLPKLKTLTVLLDLSINVSSIQNPDTHNYKIYQTREFYYILSSQCERIIGVAIDKYYMPLKEDWDKNLEYISYSKLEYFALCNSNFDSSALEKYTDMHLLKLLCVRNWTVISKGVLLKFIRLCPFLQHLDVSYCKSLDPSFLYDAIKILKEQKREPINIYYQLSGLENEIEIKNPDFWAEQQYIRLSTDFPPNSERGLSYVDRSFQFDFE